MLHGLYWLTVNLAERQPVVLAVDDVQWCDTGSLRALAFLLRRLEGLPVLIAATLRTGEPHDDEALLAELSEDLATVQVHPGPLAPEATAELVRDRLGADAHDSFTGACHRTTGGNPLLLRQLLRALQVEGVRPDASHADTVNAIGSRAVSSMVLMRLTRLPEDCTAVARALAVLGDGCLLADVAVLAGLDEPATATALAALARAEVVRPDYPLGFVHPLVGDAVYQAVSSGERELYHERAAGVLQSRGRDPRADRRPPDPRPRCAAAPTRCACCSWPPRPRPTGAPRTRPRPTSSGPSPSHPRRPNGSACCSSWAGWAR